jgi:hypothetical protein
MTSGTGTTPRDDGATVLPQAGHLGWLAHQGAILAAATQGGR